MEAVLKVLGDVGKNGQLSIKEADLGGPTVGIFVNELYIMKTNTEGLRDCVIAAFIFNTTICILWCQIAGPMDTKMQFLLMDGYHSSVSDTPFIYFSIGSSIPSVGLMCLFD